MKFLLILIMISFHFSFADEIQCVQTKYDILEKLNCLEGVIAKEVFKEVPFGTRRFNIQFDQPVDHTNKKSKSFKQTLELIHVDENRPMLLQTSGYFIFGVRQSEIAQKYNINQIQVAHRFFEGAKPSFMDWSKLTVRQSADDFHKIVVKLKLVYKKPWVSTGSSKGGMTTVFHRRFYPDDLAGSVVNVAPMTFSLKDKRYPLFMSNVGGEKYKPCREGIWRLQQNILENREKYLKFYDPDKFTQMKYGIDQALETAVVQFPNIFWQMGNPEAKEFSCKDIPRLSDSVEKKYRYLSAHSKNSHWEDEDLELFLPYYYQVATELGDKDELYDHIESLVRYNNMGIHEILPDWMKTKYSNATMLDVDNWVKTDAENIIFIYGAFDPWTGGSYDIGTNSKVNKYIIPSGNHLVRIFDLPKEKLTTALKKLEAWLGPSHERTFLPLKTMDEESLEELEFNSYKPE